MRNLPPEIRINKKAQFNLRDFLGVDFTTHESEVNFRRSPDAVNLISGQTGSVDKRFGIKIEHNFGERIWCVYRDFYASGTTYIEYSIVQSGKRLYYKYGSNDWATINNYATSLPIEIQEKETKIIDIPDVKSSSQRTWKLILNNFITNANDLIILRTQYQLGVFSIFADNLKTNTPIYMFSNIESVIKYPYTTIGRSPDGKTFTQFEERNVITSMRYNSFLSDPTSTQYIVDTTLGFVGVVEQMQPDGTFSTSLHDASNSPITYTVDNANKKITFSAVPHSTYKAGEDNIRILFSTSSTFNTSFDGISINNFKSHARYGLNGENDYLFLCNHNLEENSNLERWGKIRIPIYFPFNSYSRLGSSKKMGYSDLGDKLILHTQKTLGEPSLYLKNASLDNEGEVIFQNVPSLSNVGMISNRSSDNLRDDPLWLSEFGISSLVLNNITNIQSVQDRGFYINKQLLSESNLEKAYSFIYDNKYFICINSNVYIADPRKKYIEKLAYSESFQYDWYYWEGLDIQNHYIYNNELYFGTSNGLLMKYKKETDDRPYEDEIIGTDTVWATSTNYYEGNIVSYETKYYSCLQSHTSDTVLRNPTNAIYWQEVTKVTSVFYVPVLAYWTTPIMNMGDMTSLKTLKNLWVRLGKYANMSARIYYSTQGLISEKYDGIFDFSNIDFSRFTFSTDTDPSVLVTNRQERKFMSIQFKIESRDSYPFSLLEIVGEFILNGKYKG